MRHDHSLFQKPAPNDAHAAMMEPTYLVSTAFRRAFGGLRNA